MFGLSQILAVAVGLFFVYLLLSAITSYITEFTSNLLGLRAKFLADAIQKLLEPDAQKLEGAKRYEQAWEEGTSPWRLVRDVEILDLEKIKTNPVKAFYQHPFIQSLARPGKLPSYITSQDFSNTLLDVLMKLDGSQPGTPDEYFQKIKCNAHLLKPDLKRSLLPLIQLAEITEPDAGKRVEKLRLSIENWYSTTMDRVTGWYKNRVRFIGVLIGLVVAVLLNADTINISQILWSDAVVRQSLVVAAQSYSQNRQQDLFQAAVDNLGNIQFPLGWQAGTGIQAPIALQTNSPLALLLSVITKILGLALTGLAISVGSSIWFDILNRVVNLRSTGGRP